METDSQPPNATPLEGADNAPSSTPGASTGKNSEATSKKGPLKRKSSVPTAAKPKTRKKPKARRSMPNYTVQEGEDMLLIISNTDSFESILSPKRKGKGKKLAKARAKISKAKKKPVVRYAKGDPKKTPIKKVKQEDSFDRWGQSLPVEVLVNIFQMVVSQDGAIPFLCRAARVCHLWNAAAASPSLWRSVSVGYCWTEPGKKQLPNMQLNIRNTINWLAQNRFSQLKHFSLNHWKNQVDYAVEVVSQSCPHLQSLKLSYCTGVTEKSFQSLGDNCRSLKSINVQHSELQVDGFVSFLQSHGRQIREMLFTHGQDRLLAAISRGCCPELELLEINTKLDSGYCQIPICIKALQNHCPKLQTFRMLNVTPVYKVLRYATDDINAGFPLLEELCIATASMSIMNDQALKDILYGSPKLRVLDLRGCYRITTAGLAALPCEELECLFWGVYCSSNVASSSSKKGLHLLTEKWSGTLKEMDLTNQNFSEEDLEIAVGHLAQGAGADSFRSLNLTGTKITIPALRLIIGQATALNYLNLSSCRYLPRGLKRLYRGQEDIRQLLDKLE